MSATNDLETILNLACADPAFRVEFYEQLMSSDVIALIPRNQYSADKTVLKQGESIDILTFSNGTIPIFTSSERIWDKSILPLQQAFLEMKAVALFKLKPGITFLLNPYSDNSKELLPDEIAKLLDGTLLNQNRQSFSGYDKGILLSYPTLHPEAVIKSLNRLFRMRPEVRAAYIAFGIVGESDASEEPPRYIIGIDTEGDYDRLMREVDQVIEGKMADQQLIDFADMRYDDSIREYLRSTKPFYLREV